MSPADAIRARQLKRAEAFNVGSRSPSAFQQFAVDDTTDARALADSEASAQMQRLTAPWSPARPEPAPLPKGNQMGDFTGTAYLQASAPIAQGATRRNNFNGAEKAPDGAVVRGLDKLLYRRTGGNFVRVAPRSAEDFAPDPSDAELPFTIHGQRATIGSAGANPTNGLYSRQLNGKTDYYGKSDVQPTDQTQPVQPAFDSTAAGRANNNRLNDTLERNAYEFGVEQDRERDARTVASYSTAGAHLDLNRRSPRFGQTVSTFDPGAVNPYALTKPRRVPVPRTF